MDVKPFQRFPSPTKAWIWPWMSFPGGFPRAGRAPSTLRSENVHNKGQGRGNSLRVYQGWICGRISAEKKLIQPQSSPGISQLRVNGWSWSCHSNLSKEPRSKIHGIPADLLPVLMGFPSKLIRVPLFPVSNPVSLPLPASTDIIKFN